MADHDLKLPLCTGRLGLKPKVQLTFGASISFFKLEAGGKVCASLVLGAYTSISGHAHLLPLRVL